MSFIRAFGHLVAAPFVVLFILILPLTLWAYTLQQAAFNQSIYDRMIENDNFYTSALPFLITEAAFPPDEAGLSPGSIYIRRTLDDLTDDEWRQVADLLAPTEWIRGQTEENLDATLAWVDNTSVRPEVGFELETLRERLAGAEGAQLAQLLVDSQLICTDEENLTMVAYVDGDTSQELPQCKPQGDTSDLLVENLTLVITDSSGRLPGSIPTPEEINRELSADEQQQLLNTKANIRIVRRLAVMVFILPIALLLLVQIITVRTPKSFFGWYGWSMLLGGLLTLGSTTDAFPLLALGIFAPEPVQSEVAVFVSTLFGQLTEPVLFAGAAVTVVGLLFVLVAFVLKAPDY